MNNDEPNETNQTWRVRLWLSNEEGCYKAARRIATVEMNEDTNREDAMRRFVEELLDVNTMDGLLLDLITFDLDVVDWESVVESFQEV